MPVTNFAFLRAEWPAIYEPARRAELAARSDPRAACFYARRCLELSVDWAFTYDVALKAPYETNLSALIHDPTFRRTAGNTIFTKAKIIVRLGNRAVHDKHQISQHDSMTAIAELFQVCYWLAHTYSREHKPPAALTFDPALVPETKIVGTATLEQLKRSEAEFRAQADALTAEKSAIVAERDAMAAELERVRAEVAAAKAAAAQTPDTHDYSEAATRDFFIDLLLAEAGWPLQDDRDREYEVSGMPGGKQGFVDYVLWGDDGLPLAVVEAKRTTLNVTKGQQQAKLYADCLEVEFGRRPIIFYTNGYEHMLWDDTFYPPRDVAGFYTKSELELLIQRRTTRVPLADVSINRNIVERYYQERAIRRTTEHFEVDRQRKSLLVMATGSGKTRTVIALSDVLMRANWAKRVLFLADRTALVTQAVKAFKAHLPDSSPVNLTSERATDGRVYVSTYPTMLNLINETENGERRFGPGYFDLIIVDEAHRSIFHKYRTIFDYFDSLLIGLTATPKDEIDRNTYGVFELERGVPTDAYSLEEAVADGFLVPPLAVDVPLKFARDGIRYDDLDEEEKDDWDTLDWNEGDPPDAIGADAVNKWLFNEDTVDKVLAHLMTNGLKVAGGDRLAKTILFAKNQAHADFIAARFDANYPHYRGEFARIITHKVDYAQTLIDDFSNPAKSPHIAISVDMLDTGIDVPEVGNLVFFKQVRSKTKFWQMVGRGTRLSPDLLGPGEDKKFFYIFDFCGNLQYFAVDVPDTEGSMARPLSARLFDARVALVAQIDATAGDAAGNGELRQATAAGLAGYVAAMNTTNVVVRPKRRLVEHYSTPQAWGTITAQSQAEVSQELATLPAEVDAEPEESKRFDLLMLNLQLAYLRADPSFARLRGEVQEIAALLEGQGAIPMVRSQLPFIEELQTDEWWQDVTLPMLETARVRLRDLVRLIDTKQKRHVLYTDFEDELAAPVEVALPGVGASAMEAVNWEKFRAKTRAFLREHEDHVAIRKVRLNKPLTETDVSELERMLAENVSDADTVRRAAEESHGLGLFVRSLIGLDREAAKQALGDFAWGKDLSGTQIEFVNLIVDHLTQNGIVDAAALYESPFTDVSPHGPEGIFEAVQVAQLIEHLHEVRQSAIA